MKLNDTLDGSHTLFSTTYNATYHSVNGAIQESMHVYIQEGLLHHQKSKLTILEVGFGTGLNTWLTLHYGKTKIIHYDALEPIPISSDIVQDLNYTKKLPELNAESFFKLHHSSWDTNHHIRNSFSFKKYQESIQNFETCTRYDIVYFDAFGPSSQPELWTSQIAKKLFNYLNPEGFLVTFCAQGEFKRILKNCGFYVESPAGPPGKREMTRAIKPDTMS